MLEGDKEIDEINEWTSKIEVELEKQKQPSWGGLKKGFLKICSKFTREHPCQSTIAIKIQH